MINSITKSFNSLNGQTPNFSQQKKKQNQEKKPDIDLFPTAEVMRINREKKAKEQFELGQKIKKLKDENNYAAVAYLKCGLDRNFHLVNINILDDIIIREPPKNVVDIII